MQTTRAKIKTEIREIAEIHEKRVKFYSRIISWNLRNQANRAGACLWFRMGFIKATHLCMPKLRHEQSSLMIKCSAWGWSVDRDHVKPVHLREWCRVVEVSCSERMCAIWYTRFVLLYKHISIVRSCNSIYIPFLATHALALEVDGGFGLVNRLSIVYEFAFDVSEKNFSKKNRNEISLTQIVAVGCVCVAHDPTIYYYYPPANERANELPIDFFKSCGNCEWVHVNPWLLCLQHTFLQANSENDSWMRTVVRHSNANLHLLLFQIVPTFALTTRMDCCPLNVLSLWLT